MSLARIRLITFDVTDTLLQFKNSLGKQYSEIGAIHGIFCDKNALAANFKTHWYQLKKEYPNFGKGNIGWEGWWKLMVFRTFKDACINAEDDKLEKISANLIDLYKTNACWQQCYGTLGLLSYLKNKQFKMGVISNFDDRLPAILDSTCLRHYFQFILTSYGYGFEKPDIKIFKEAMKLSCLEDLKPDECLHIGDTLKVDYIGAKNAGWNSLLVNKHVTNIGNHVQINPKDVFSSLYDIHKSFVETSSC